MALPLIGSWTGTVHAARPYAIHGDLYYEIHCADPDDPGRLVALRVPQHALAGGAPAAGERLTFSILMGQVTGASRA